MEGKGNKYRLNLMKFIGEHRQMMILSMSVMLITTGLSVITPWLMQYLVDKALPQKDVNLLVLCVAGIAIIPIINMLITALENVYKSDVQTRITVKLRFQLLDKLLKLSPTTLSKYQQGDITGRLVRTCDDISGFVTKLLNGFNNVITFVFIGIVMLTMNWKLSGIVLFFAPLMVYFYYRRIRFWRTTYKDISQAQKEYDVFITEVVPGLKTIQTFGQEQHEIANGQELNRKYRNLQNQLQKQRSFQGRLFWELQDSLSTSLVYAAGIYFIFHQQMTIGQLLAFTVYVPRFYGAINSLFVLYMDRDQLKPEIERYEEMMDFPDENVDESNAISMKEVKGQIEFEHVSFGYSDEREILQDVSFAIKPGEFIGIVGATGGGKSTIIDLLLRFGQPRTGQILLDGQPLNAYQLKDYRKQIGLVPQDIFLWNRTIRENLLYVNPSATEEELRKAADQAQMKQLIENLPEGWNTLIGDRGVRLSGGEKQRLAIARTLLRKPSILLLDEPTSALDAKTEFLLQACLEEVYQEKTIIVVAHRLATIRNADRILVVNQGRIEESGSHEELMEKKGYYYELAKQQYQVSTLVG
ncbi:ABC transporter ATP-binding protein [Shimazuella kribbensis]|uniref:ABC transporter ATP-binding protein n=1 Tax=Shimazuella kribbensis TaxID=139808 RepID=UPI000413E028|nr:ABC transporter ATP-binding protein [Shimazuella kribbensis]